MVTAVRRCDGKCGKEIPEGFDFFVLSISVAVHRNLLKGSAEELTGPTPPGYVVEVCSQSCAIDYVQKRLDAAAQTKAA